MKIEPKWQLEDKTCPTYLYCQKFQNVQQCTQLVVSQSYFVSVIAMFGTWTLVSVNGTLVEAKMCTFTLAKFSTSLRRNGLLCRKHILFGFKNSLYWLKSIHVEISQRKTLLARTMDKTSGRLCSVYDSTAAFWGVWHTWLLSHVTIHTIAVQRRKKIKFPLADFLRFRHVTRKFHWNEEEN